MKPALLLLAACFAAAPPLATAQRRPASAQPAGSPAAAAPVDLTGYWVSPVMEDWRWRMMTPLKGDAASIPLKAEARPVVEAWDPADDEASGDTCKAYGAPGLLRLPGRLRISWEDDRTLKIEADAGTQTRLLHFDAPPPPGTSPTRQGYSSATWNPAAAESPVSVPGLGMAPPAPIVYRTLVVTTTHLLPGYLRKNGVPYSAETTVTEYFDRFSEPDGAEWFTVTTIVTDPVYLGMPFVTTTDFRKEPDGSRWNPTACTAR
jgi:hypothetical protein